MNGRVRLMTLARMPQVRRGAATGRRGTPFFFGLSGSGAGLEAFDGGHASGRESDLDEPLDPVDALGVGHS